jgi:hypothetical protein
MTSIYLSEDEFKIIVGVFQQISNWDSGGQRHGSLRIILRGYPESIELIDGLILDDAPRPAAKKLLSALVGAGSINPTFSILLNELIRDDGPLLDTYDRKAVELVLKREEISVRHLGIEALKIVEAYSLARRLWPQLISKVPRSVGEAIQTIVSNPGATDTRATLLVEFLVALDVLDYGEILRDQHFLDLISICGLPTPTPSVIQSKHRAAVFRGQAHYPVIAIVLFPPENPIGTSASRSPLRARMYGLGENKRWRELGLMSSSPASLSHIRSCVQKKLGSVIREMKIETAENARIDFFLPFHLMDLRVERWQIEIDGQLKAIGDVNQVVIRSADRWHRGVSEAVHRNMEEHWSMPGMEPYRLCRLSALLDDPYKPFAGLVRPLFIYKQTVRRHGVEFWQEVVRLGIPSGMWARRATTRQEDTVEDDLNTLIQSCDGKLDDLPRRVFAHRLKSTYDTSLKIGSGISLFFESKDQWPPTDLPPNIL